MSISDLGSVGEFISSLVVILSVIYLAAQVRQGNKASRNSAMQNIISGMVESANRVADSAEFAEIAQKAISNPGGLNEIERLRFNCHMVAPYHNLDGAYHMYQAGLLDQEIWSKYDYEIPVWMHLPAVADWYETDRKRFSPAFQKYLEKRVAETAAPDLLPTFAPSNRASDARRS